MEESCQVVGTHVAVVVSSAPSHKYTSTTRRRDHQQPACNFEQKSRERKKKISREKAGGGGGAMSWQAYVDEHLLCDHEGQRLTAAAILGHDGSVWAQSETFPEVYSPLLSISPSAIVIHTCPPGQSMLDFAEILRVGCLRRGRNSIRLGVRFSPALVSARLVSWGLR
jgi:hypothetical protein